MLFDIRFDPASMETIGRMALFDVFLAEEMAPVMEEAGKLVTEAAQGNTWRVFAHPTGELAGSLAPELISPFEVGMVAGVPYAWRRERGFSGMTDSLGRYFANDPAKPYAQPALDANADKVVELMDLAIIRTWERIGGL